MRLSFLIALLLYTIHSLPVDYNTKRTNGNESGTPSKRHRHKQCYFSTTRTNKEFEKAPRPEKSIVSTDCSPVTEKTIGDYYDYEVNPSTGEENAASLLLCRGSGICDEDFKNPEVIARWKNIPICQNHADELLEKWDNSQNFLHKHVYRRKQDGTYRLACSVPDGLADSHVGARTTVYHHHLTIQEADLLMKEKGILVHPGIPVCHLHKEYLTTLKENFAKNAGKSKPVVNYVEEGFEPNICDDEPEYTCSGPNNQSPAMSSLQQFADAVGVDLSCTARKPYSELQDRSRQKKAVAVKKLINVIVDVIAPDDKEEFKARVFKNQVSDLGTSRDDYLNKIMKQVSDHYFASHNRLSRMTVLSLVSDVLPFSAVVKYIPNLSRYLYGEARKFSRRNSNSVKPEKKLERYNREAVENFIDFITSPTVMLGLPYGIRKVKLSDGAKIEIPDTIRQQSSTEIYNMYHSMLEESGRMDLKLSKSSIYRILEVCEATERSATTCVDYFVANGMAAFDGFHSIVDDWIEQDVIDNDILKELKMELFEAAQYLRTDYRLHVKSVSRVADHCSTYALSDPNDARLSLSCSSGTHSHKHDLKCPRCENANSTLYLIKHYAEELLTESKNSEKNGDEEMQKTIAQLVNKYDEQVQLIGRYIDQVFEMKKHLLRAAATNQEREDILLNLNDNEAFITIDFAQKYLPQSHREKQSEYFGKKGLSYHVANVAALIGENMTQHTFVHIYDSEVQQNSALVVLTLSHIAKELKKVGIETISIRSDNAAAYHCASTIASLRWLMNEFGITVKSYSFSEAQNGKSSSDRDAARVKRKLFRHVARGKNVPTSSDFFKAVSTEPKLNGVSFHHGSVEVDDAGESQWPGISYLNYFTVGSDGVRGRKYSGIGEGIFVPNELLKSLNGTHAFEEAGFVASGIDSIESERKAVQDGLQTKFWYFSPKKKCKVPKCVVERDDVDTEFDEATDTQENSNRLFLCPHPGCSSSFLLFSNLEKHLRNGVHKIQPEKMTMIDYSLRMYSRGLEEINRRRPSNGLSDVVVEALNDLNEQAETSHLYIGWALPKKVTRKAFVEDVKKFLIECFNEGIQKKRLNPTTIAKRMATATKADGTKRFTVEQRLDVQQIAGFLSRQSREERKKNLRVRRDENNIVHVLDPDNDEDMEERHWDADWIDFIDDEATWTEWNEFLNAIAEHPVPLFTYH